MKYIKKFENIKDGPKEGDYVLMKSTMMNPDMNEFIDNNIGKILKIKPTQNYTSLEVEYKNITIEIASKFGYNDYKNDENTGIHDFLMSSVVDYSENNQDLEYKINARKFNI